MNAHELQTFVRIINSMSDFDFITMYGELGFDAPYANEKYYVMLSHFIRWVCELDEATLNQIIGWVKANRM